MHVRCLARVGWPLMLLLLAPNVPAQSQTKFSPTTPRADSANSPTNEASEQRTSALLHVRGLADRARSFHDAEAKVRTLIGLGDLLWPYDASYARDLFASAHQVCIASDGEKLPPGKLLELRSEIIAALARRDAALAWRLADADAAPAADRAFADQRAAANLLTANKVPEAVEFATRSLRIGVPRQMVSFLLRLRHQSETAADELYQTTLSRLAAEPVVDGLSLMELGAYVFTSPFTNQELEERGAVIMQSVGNSVVINLSLARPGMSPDAARAYLATAADILSRRPTDPQQQRLYYVTAYQLLPHAQRLAPALAPRLAVALQALTPDVPQALTQQSAYAALAPTENYTFGDTLRELDEIGEPVAHDQRAMLLATGLCFAGDFAKARVVAERVREQAARSKVLNLIGAADATKLLERGATDAAEEAAGKLAPSVERAVLWLTVARARSRAGERARASEALNALLRDARRLDDGRQPFLLLAAAGESARFDAAGALQIFNEAVKALNAGTGKPVKWTEVVEVGGRGFQFALRGLDDANTIAAIRQLYAADPQGAEAVALTLRHERLLGPALRALAESMLAAVPKGRTL